MSQPQTSPIHQAGLLPSARHLRAALRANSAFSFASGAAMMIGGPLVAGSWGLGPWWLTAALGLGVIAFAVVVAWVAVLPARRLRPAAIGVTIADLGWVAGSAAVIAAARPPATGTAAIAAIAAIVAAVAVAQTAGLARSRAADPLADVEVIEAAAVLPAPPDLVWPVLTDHDLYGRLAPNLARVEVISEPDEPLRRHCVAATGGGWDETCTLWEAGRRYAVEVDTASYPYPMAAMTGLWQADPHQGGTLTTMRFAYQAKPTIAGGLFALVARPAFPVILRRILAGWRAELAGPTPARDSTVAGPRR